MPAPTNLEQLLLEYVNAARLDPLGDAARYISSYAPLTSPDSNIQGAINFFGVNGALFLSQMQALAPVQPLAWNDSIATAARNHSQVMIDQDSQTHQGAGEAALGARVTAAGYNWSNLGENVFAFSQSMLHAHAGFMIDWGGTAATGGMQSPPGHRDNIMSGTFREIGIGVIAEGNPATQVGPLVVTEDFGRALAGPAVFLLGVSYADFDADRFYSVGEGRAGMSVAATGGSTATTASGGYALGLAAGAQTVTFSGGGLLAPLSVSGSFATGVNAKLDVIGQSEVATSASLQIVSGVTVLRGLGLVGLTLTGAGGSESLIGTKGGDILTGGAGNDTLDGGAGTDTANYADRALAVAINPFINTAAVAGGELDTILNFENFTGGGGNDTIQGTFGVNIISGGGGNDLIYAFDGADLVDGGAGNDVIAGGAGDDTITGGDGGDWLYGEDGNDNLSGTAKSGGAFDVIVGGNGADTLEGSGGGFDYFYGGVGVNGATGDGNDTYIVRAATGIKVMNDFEVGGTADVIRLLGTGFTTFAQVQAALSFSGTINGTVLVVDGTTQIWFLNGTQPANLTAADFAFV
jgi:Ca2+-binding RTX toxin-like protein